MGEASLVEQAKSGNKDALLELIMNQKDEYYRLAYVYLGNPDDALDILQDTIVTLYQNIRKLRKNEVFHSWAKTILVNLCKKQLKRKKRIISFEAVSNVNLYSNINLSKHSSARSNLSSHLDLKIEPASKTPASICGLTSKKEQMIDKEIPISAHSKKVEIGTGDVYFSIENVSLKDGKTYLEIKRKNNVEAVFGLFAADKQLTQLSKKTLPATSDQENDITREILEYDRSSNSLKLMVKVLQINTPYDGKLEILQ